MTTEEITNAAPETGRHPLHMPAGDALALSARGGRYAIPLRAEDTGGAIGLLDITVPPGAGSPPHYHTRDAEGFFFLEGAFVMTLVGADGAARTVEAAPGTFVHVAPYQIHNFRNSGDGPGRMLCWFTPGGQENYFFEAATWLAEHGDGDIPAMAAAFKGFAARYGTVNLAPGDLAPPAERPADAHEGFVVTPVADSGPVRVLAGDAQTGGAYSAWVRTLAPSETASSNLRDEDAKLHVVLSGTVEYTLLEGETFDASPGDAVWWPARTPHAAVHRRGEAPAILLVVAPAAR